MANNDVLNGLWTVRWISGQTAKILVKNGEFEVFGQRYVLDRNKNPVQFVWPDGVIQTVTTACPNIIQWRTTHSDPAYHTIFWERSTNLRRMCLQSTDQDYKELNRPDLLRAMIQEFAQQEGVNAGGTMNVVVLSAANADRKILEGPGTGCLEAVKKTLTSLNIAQTVTGYRFFIDRVGLENAMRYIQQPCIVVVLGGNTFTLNNGLHKVPGFRAKLIERIKNGKVMYVSSSAGTIIAGTRLHKFEHTGDDPAAVGNERVNMEGLGIYYEGQMNPHARNRPGEKLEAGQALFVIGSWCRKL